MVSLEMISEMLKTQLNASVVTVKDLTGKSNHFEAVVVAEVFEGKSMIEQHQLVYAPLQPFLATGELHALALKTYTPAQFLKVNS
jgi:acid stress-induced BolA-like protein IbaG/YrbA